MTRSMDQERYMLLTTFRRDGTAVSTPVWVVAFDDHELGFWTSSKSGKAKRLAHSSSVVIQACNALGKVRPGSAPEKAKARLVQGSEYEAILAKVKAKYGFQIQLPRMAQFVIGTLKGKRIPFGDIGVLLTTGE